MGWGVVGATVWKTMTAAVAAASGGYTEGARVYNSANISIPHATFTALTFDSERYDTDAIHDTATNTSRLTCKTAGKYIIDGNVEWGNGADTGRYCRIRLNGTTDIAAVAQAGQAWMVQQVSAVYDLAVNDYVELVVYQSTGGAFNALVGANYSPEFWMQRIG